MSLDVDRVLGMRRPTYFEIDPKSSLGRVVARMAHHHVPLGAWAAEGLDVELEPVAGQLWLKATLKGVPKESADAVAASVRAGGARLYSMAPREIVIDAKSVSDRRRIRDAAAWGLLPSVFAIPLVAAQLGPDAVRLASWFAACVAGAALLGAAAHAEAAARASSKRMRLRVSMPSLGALDQAAAARRKGKA